MAGKNINIVSKTLAESYIRKQIKALKQDPAQTIHTLTKQLLEKPDSPLEKYLLHITPEKLQDTQSGYYQLFHDILPKINTEHLVTLAMNIGYNSIGGKIKLSTNDIIKAYNDVVNKPTSNYYVSTTTEGSYHNMYSSICNQITQGKDIVNRFEKTLLVGMLFNFIRYETNNKA